MWPMLRISTASLSVCCLVAIGHAQVAVAATAVDVQPNSKTLTQIAKDLNRAAVDARIDRVWHAIPGLSGWQLDIPKSEEESTQLHDGKVHLVWSEIAPKNRLASLAAEPIFRGPAEEKSASIMVNVSWGEEYIPSMLKTLADHHVKATFFLDGGWVKKHETMARKIVEEGEDVGSHGSNHPDFRKLTDAQLAEQVDGTNQVLYQALGVKTRCIAPPSGAFDKRLIQMTKARDMYSILWTADTVDWQRPKPAIILERVRQHLTPGALILMHPTAQTAEALPGVLNWLQAQGYHIKTVDDVVNERPVIKPPATLSKQG